ncbi:MAG: hypothetical protein GVY05_09415 [Bacteroidetes bacterium]|jgi:hypothetical protein|nr:hypothetical protein [Bacteroidota bacterium]
MSTQPEISQLNKSQLEILKLFSRELDDTDLKAIKKLIVQYLAKKLTVLADEKWDENNWNDEDMERLLHSHHRTTYDSKN